MSTQATKVINDEHPPKRANAEQQPTYSHAAVPTHQLQDSPLLVKQREQIAVTFGSPAQRMPVAQLVIHTIPQVTYTGNGGANGLRAGILRWCPNRPTVTVTPTDYTGTSFRVVFDSGNRALTLSQAEAAVTRAGGVLPDVESSSEEESDTESDTESRSDDEDDDPNDPTWRPGMRLNGPVRR